MLQLRRIDPLGRGDPAVDVEAALAALAPAIERLRDSAPSERTQQGQTRLRAVVDELERTGIIHGTRVRCGGTSYVVVRIDDHRNSEVRRLSLVAGGQSISGIVQDRRRRRADEDLPEVVRRLQIAGVKQLQRDIAAERLSTRRLRVGATAAIISSRRTSVANGFIVVVSAGSTAVLSVAGVAVLGAFPVILLVAVLSVAGTLVSRNAADARSNDAARAADLAWVRRNLAPAKRRDAILALGALVNAEEAPPVTPVAPLQAVAA